MVPTGGQIGHSVVELTFKNPGSGAMVLRGDVGDVRKKSQEVSSKGFIWG
jgi:hypothetical protein